MRRFDFEHVHKTIVLRTRVAVLFGGKHHLESIDIPPELDLDGVYWVIMRKNDTGEEYATTTSDDIPGMMFHRLRDEGGG